MKVRKYVTPDYVFELSWEVCNKVGGIHTVLASLAPTLGKHFGDKVVYIGPDLNTPEFLEDKSLKKDWAAALKAAGMRVRIGRWDVVSSPLAIVVDVNQCLDIKNEVYSRMWDKYKVDSLHAYGDYDEASMWAYASGRVVETIVQKCLKKDASVVLQAHEWLSAMGLLHVKGTCPSVATVFTTHATSIGRSICGNGKSLYKYLQQYDGDVMARELPPTQNADLLAFLQRAFPPAHRSAGYDCNQSGFCSGWQPLSEAMPSHGPGSPEQALSADIVSESPAGCPLHRSYYVNKHMPSAKYCFRNLSEAFPLSG